MCIACLLRLSEAPHTESLRQGEEGVEVFLLDVHHPVVHEVEHQRHVAGRGVPHHDDRVLDGLGALGLTEGPEHATEPLAAGGQDQSVALQGLGAALQRHVLQVPAVKLRTQARAETLGEVIPLEAERLVCAPHFDFTNL